MSATTLKRESARERILDLAAAAVLQKGFGATSIEELIAGAGISKSGFFYHFSDKNALAKALLERSMERDRELLGDVFARADDLADDPLHGFLVGLKMLAEQMAEMAEVHPGCMVASICYQEQLFDREIVAMNRASVLEWRQYFRARLDVIAARYPPRIAADLDGLADMLSVVIDGGITMSKVTRDASILAQQVALYRAFIRAIFLGT
ncbi:TetR/AcrR family transcriptional regulator [Roseomonas terrae]|uniref:TetR/AcrR family transcriptional regulator n=1 Tax=Neoroseomonas terrae TaxID=424799 RepID=A0ABS5EK42_9PROT|nr:TetR/AcrR family transcriptional regulator [Neoroseomonas terrae]MBR0651392.1 TetR/AcrR family transcriptional regulator [Neoroseomonas terrae]